MTRRSAVCTEAGRTRPPGTFAAGVALLLAVVASAIALFAPTGVSETSVERHGSEEPAHAERTRAEPTTLIGEEPGPALTVAAVAVLLAGVPLALNGTRLRSPARALAATLLFAGSFVAGFSVGLFYLPSAVAMAVAATRS